MTGLGPKIGLVVLVGLALAAAAHIVLKIGWLVTLLVAPMVVLVLGLIIQVLGILSREEPR